MFNIISTLVSITLITYALVIILTPVFRKKISAKHLGILYIITSGLFTLTLILCAKFCFFESKVFAYNFDNFTKGTNLVDLSLNFSIDSLGLSFAFLVGLIAFTTNIYTLTYFRGEADESNFMFWLNSFVLSMIILVFAGNFFTIFLGWELIGITSFFLINFWRTRRGVVKSSFKAVVFNLVSDIFLLSSLVSFYQAYHTTNCVVFINLLNTVPSDNFYTIFGLICLVICSSIKSVQLIGHLWLPDSMEAPVPASSLIHSATLVSAGIYLLCKFNPLIVYVGATTALISIGAITAAYGGVVAAAQTDMKKLLAYSTMSHCGFLWILASSGNFVITILYLYLHGIFKAATFYCAGSFIRAYNTQDTRWMGSGASFLRLDSFLLVFCAANLAGLPFSMGAMYKVFFIKLLLTQTVVWWQLGFIFIGLASSIVYFYRLINYAVFDYYKGAKVFPNYVSLFTIVKQTNLRFTTRNHLLAVFFLLFFALVVTYILYWGLKQNISMYEVIYEELSTSVVAVKQLEYLHISYVILFYILYFVLFVLLCLVVCRPNIFAIETVLTLLYFSLIIGFFSLSCEVILWQKLIQ